MTQVSADRFVDENTGEAFYKLKAQVAPEGMKMIADLRIRPGMPVELIREDWGTYHDELYPEADTGSSKNVNDRGMKWLSRRVV